MRPRIAAAALGLALLVTPALADEAPIMGAGIIDGGCGKWLRSTPDSFMDAAYTSWFLGYLSGFNVAGTFSTQDFIAPNAAALDWLRLYCRNHPLAATYAAANALIAERLRPPPSASSGATPDTIIPTRRR
jgi:hypothetical protein